MSKVFGTIAAVILAATAFVAFKNKEAYQAEVETNKKALQLKTSTEKDLLAEQDRLTKAEATTAEKNTAAKATQVELDEVTKQLEEKQGEVKALETQHASNETKIAAASEALKELPDPDDLIPKLKRMRSGLTEATGEIASKEATLANLIQRSQSASTTITEKRKFLELYSTGKSFPTLSTKISSVYRNWGFVILSGGDRQGVVSGSTLDVIRGGEIVAKLKVTAVEAGRSSADIVLDSIAEGVTLHAGDTVVAEKETTSPATAAVAQ